MREHNEELLKCVPIFFFFLSPESLLNIFTFVQEEIL